MLSQIEPPFQSWMVYTFTVNFQLQLPQRKRPNSTVYNRSQCSRLLAFWWLNSCLVDSRLTLCIDVILTTLQCLKQGRGYYHEIGLPIVSFSLIICSSELLGTVLNRFGWNFFLSIFHLTKEAKINCSRNIPAIQYVHISGTIANIS